MKVYDMNKAIVLRIADDKSKPSLKDTRALAVIYSLVPPAGNDATTYVAASLTETEFPRLQFNYFCMCL